MTKKLSCISVAAGLLLFLGGAEPLQTYAQEPRANSLGERWKARMASRQGDGGEASEQIKITGPGDYSFALHHQGLRRLFRVYVPSTYSPSKAVPLVFSFHGGGGSMDYQATDHYYGQISKAEALGYVAVFPNGFSKLRSGKLATWNAGRCCASARDGEVDDVGFVRAIIQTLSLQIAVDTQRIFASGMSNGGMMSYRLACEMPDVFRAIASVAGTDNTTSCAPKGPISILHIHARDDELVLFDGGSGRKSSKVADFVSVPDSIAKWVKLNACGTTPTRVFENAGAYCDVYSQCRGGVEVKLCVTATGGHSWPGGYKLRGNTPGSSALSATDVIADFFTHRP